MSATLFTTLPQCPKVDVLLKALGYPSVFLTFVSTAVASFVFVLVVMIRYNAVRVFDHKIRTPSISNSLWIAFYLFVFLGSVVNAIRFALSEVADQDKWFEIVSLVLHGLSTVSLSLTLNHQRRFRSSTESSSVEDSESDPLVRRYDRLRSTISMADVFFVLLFVLYVVFAWLAVLHVGPSNVLQWTFVGVFVVQRLPAIVLSILIVFFPKTREPDPSAGTVTEAAYVMSDGPTRNAKILLAFATVLSISGDVPLSVWALAFGDSDCVFYIASGTDLIHLLYVVGLVLYFLFLRSEYLRNMEQCVWSAVKKFQRNFDFRSGGNSNASPFMKF